jgi:pimeloyl-ACP methyl ester carboxylesterase
MTPLVHHEVRGTGPLLLISQSGEGTAGRTVDLVDRLVPHFTVVTYDRRGLSRSGPAGPVTIREHAEDVHRLLASLTTEPAAVLGCSLGAAIGLRLVAEHPEQVSTLIAHEPVTPWLLPDRAHHDAELAHVQQTYQADGLAAAVKEIVAVLGLDPAGRDVEPDLTPQPMTPQRVADFDHFLTHDITAVRTDEPVDVTRSGVRIVPAAGRTTPRTVFDRLCADELARLLNVDVAVFPGGHNGNLTHPRAYAARLRELLG